MSSIVLVTGAAGFIGSTLCERLQDSGHEVVGIDNFDPYYSPISKRRNAEALGRAGVKVWAVDVLDRAALGDIFVEFQPKYVVHLAGKAGVRASIESPAEYIETNVIGTHNVLQESLDNGADRVLLASTSSVYGHRPKTPFDEQDPAVDPPQPYAFSKRASELIAKTYFDVYGLHTTVLRFFTVYGPRGRPDMMPFKLADSILTGAEVPYYGSGMSRDWTYVTDICDGIRAALVPALGYDVINLGRGHPVSLADFVSELELVSGGKANLRPTKPPPGEMLMTYADNSKAESLLAFKPRVGIALGVRLFWEWYASTNG